MVCPEGNDAGLQANLCDLIFLGGVPPQISHKIIINRVLFAKLEGAFYKVLWRCDPYHLLCYGAKLLKNRLRRRYSHKAFIITHDVSLLKVKNGK